MKFVCTFALFACLYMYLVGIQNVYADCKLKREASDVATKAAVFYCNTDAQPRKVEGDAIIETMSSGRVNYNARYGGIEHIEADAQVYINAQLTKSLEYLLLATHFNSFVLNRPGFQQLYQQLSDRCFDDAINLSRQLTRRGGALNLSTEHVSPAFVSPILPKVEVSELDSLALALESEKQLAEGANYVHSVALSSAKIDAEFAHYMEENFLGQQAASIRKLAGHVNDLNKLLDDTADAVALYIFDQHLSEPTTKAKKSSSGLHG